METIVQTEITIFISMDSSFVYIFHLLVKGLEDPVHPLTWRVLYPWCALVLFLKVSFIRLYQINIYNHFLRFLS